MKRTSFRHYFIYLIIILSGSIPVLILQFGEIVVLKFKADKTATINTAAHLAGSGVSMQMPA